MAASPALFSVVEGYSLAVFFVLWAVVGLTDWAQRKIQHRYLVYGTLGALLGYAAIFANTVIMGFIRHTGHYHYMGFYYAAAGHVLLSVLAAVLLWYLEVWPAGDVKLFSLLAVLYPMMNSMGSFHYQHLFLEALINTFIPASFYLFFKACYYVFDTRLRHSRDFLAQLGWRREMIFLWEKTAEQLRALPEAVASWRPTLSDPKPLLLGLLKWLFGMVLMSVISYYLKDFFRSPVLLSVLCVALFFIWGRVSALVGPTASWALPAALLAALVWRDRGFSWPLLAVIFGNITLFSFFMYLGMNWAMKLVSGGAGSAGLVLPFLFPLVCLAVGSLWHSVLQLIRWVIMRLSNLGGYRPIGPILYPHYAPPPGVMPYLDTLMILSALGLFFGLSLVLVRRWDEEVRPTHLREALSSYVVLAPSFLQRLRQDQEFYEQHFRSTYADGLTHEQAEALKGWCAENGIDAVPLAPTMSFASWIFLGFLLTRLLDGGNILQALL